MEFNDWYAATGQVIKAIAKVIWSGITWPLRFISSWPDWTKGIILGILVLLAAYITYKLWKSWNKQEYRFIDS